LFLATTALSEFWDKDHEILFLGSWCLRHDRRATWEVLKYQVLPSPWDDRKRFYDACRYLDEFGERILNQLADYLNAVHGVSHSRRYWRILIGPWLIHYLHAVYDRYIHITEAFSRFPRLQTIVLDPQSFWVPRDTEDLVGLISDDPYNLQICSQLIRAMGYSFPKRVWTKTETAMLAGEWRCAPGTLPPSAVRREIGNVVPRQAWYDGMKVMARTGSSLFDNVVRRALGIRWRIALCDISAQWSTVCALAWRSGLRTFPVKAKKGWSFTVSCPVFDHRRNGLGSLAFQDGFERILTHSLPQNFPTLYLEEYQSARAEILEDKAHLPLVVVSATGWYFHEPFKYLVAETAEKNSRLITVQHGGGYGIFRFSAPELHETRVGDSFIAWGWADKEKKSLRNLPSLELSSLLTGQFRKTRFPKAMTILFVVTAHPRYLYRFHSTPVGSQWEDYFAWQFRFLTTITDKLRHVILYQNYPHEYGFAVRERVSERFPEIRWNDGRSMKQRLKHSRMVVIDNCATTCLQALTANVPTILFWDPLRWEVRDEAEPYFESLRKAGILWDSPEAAAKKVTAIYDDPWTWWDSKAVQEVRRRFVDRYALARKDWVACWAKALEEELTLSRGAEL
jgi:putative transferase (TIGR04331 family)